MSLSEEGRVLSPNRCKRVIGTIPTDDHLRIDSPLSLWNLNIAHLTGLSAMSDVSSAYTMLLYHLDNFQFKGKLSEDSTLWMQQPLLSGPQRPYYSQ